MRLTGYCLMRHSPNGQPNWMPVSMSELTDRYILSRWVMRWQITPHPDSSLHDPYGSVQSVLVEFGSLGSAAIGLFFVWLLI
jgi:hypothetical protein